VLTLKGYRSLDSADKRNILNVLNGVNDTFVVVDLFPRFYRLPVSGQVT
jgi:hypothetical protein